MSWTNLKLIQPEGSGLPVFCVQGDQANKLIPKYLGPVRPFYAFLHQGNDGRRIALDKVDTVANHFISELKDACPKGPYLLCGYSFGGMVAYEMAQQLTAMGDEVPLLVLIDTHAPRLHAVAMKEDTRFYQPLKEAILRNTAESRLRKGLPIHGRLRHFHIIDTYHRAMLAYEPKPYRGRLTVFKAKNTRGAIDLGWHEFAVGGFDLQIVPGDHTDLIKAPHVARIAELLAARIAAIEEQRADRVP